MGWIVTLPALCRIPMHRWGSRYMLRGLLLVTALCRSAAVRPCERRLGSCRKDKQRELWRARHLQRFSELGGDRHDLRGPMRQRVVSDTMHHRLVRQAHASLPVWKSKFYGAFVLNHRVILHAIDAMPARWRGDAGSSPLERSQHGHVITEK